MQHSGNQALPTPAQKSNRYLLIAHGSRQQVANDDLHDLAARLRGSGTLPDRRCPAFSSWPNPTSIPAETAVPHSAQPMC